MSTGRLSENCRDTLLPLSRQSLPLSLSPFVPTFVLSFLIPSLHPCLLPSLPTCISPFLLPFLPPSLPPSLPLCFSLYISLHLNFQDSKGFISMDNSINLHCQSTESKMYTILGNFFCITSPKIRYNTNVNVPIH